MKGILRPRILQRSGRCCANQASDRNAHEDGARRHKLRRGLSRGAVLAPGGRPPLPASPAAGGQAEAEEGGSLQEIGAGGTDRSGERKSGSSVKT